MVKGIYLFQNYLSPRFFLSSILLWVSTLNESAFELISLIFFVLQFDDETADIS